MVQKEEPIASHNVCLLIPTDKQHCQNNYVEVIWNEICPCPAAVDPIQICTSCTTSLPHVIGNMICFNDTEIPLNGRRITFQCSHHLKNDPDIIINKILTLYEIIISGKFITSGKFNH